MIRILRRPMAVLLLTGLLVGSGMQAEAKSPTVAEYTAPDGLKVISTSPNWSDPNKLKSLHDELLQNVHGDEIKLLKEIDIYDDYPSGNGVAGQYIFQTLSSVLPVKQKMQPGKIELYGGHEHQDVASFAHTLSHEYGHHVTHYYTLQTDGYALTDPKRWKETTYARMRGLSNDERVAVDDVDHRWQIAEIAAEDYVQMFGSPLAHEPTKFESRVEQAVSGKEPAAMSWSASMYNVQPQENLALPLASDVPGLYSFFYKQIKGDDGKYAPPVKPVLNLASYAKQGDVGYQLQFSWSLEGEKPNVAYTLVTYSDKDLLAEPVVTKTAQQKHEVKYGPVVTRRGGYIYTYQEPSAKGVRHFKLYAFGDNGWVSESPVLTVDLSNPTQVQVVEKDKVVPVAKSAVPAMAEPTFELPSGGWIESVVGNLKRVIDAMSSFLHEFFA
ncbi:hypothetical protein [Tumebacillus permanentifrigoris]|uniref:Uncharacterized protein n=1 Tax=Tumebacillus permanentifrigoris TaxID=378543 RepID=A0A316DE96_9BACL|nr:hypothetical protein [Tumebacillus permanentifrigoris]PWK14267.1 hypothetical protein C7459_10521 [Tumebacillus permanentifrigoris]